MAEGLQDFEIVAILGTAHVGEWIGFPGRGGLYVSVASTLLSGRQPCLSTTHHPALILLKVIVPEGPLSYEVFVL